MKANKQITINVGGRNITLTHDIYGVLTAEMCVDGRYFVMTGDKDGNFYTQENLEDGEIVDLFRDDNLCVALEHLAGANRYYNALFL